MPRENSFSDSEGRSLTPDLADELEMEREIEQATRSPPAAFPLSDSETTATNSPAPPAATPKFVSVASAPGGLQPPGRPSLRVPGHASDRFRSSVRKVMQMHRTSTMMTISGVGAEPGVDPRRSDAERQYGHLKKHCVIQINDYSATSCSFGKMTNMEFVKLMRDREASKPEPWVKVRWINIGGISWDVIKALAIRYDLHPLSLEDVLHQPRHARSKVDYYHKHLFLRILCHSVASDDRTPHENDSVNFPHGDSADEDGFAANENPTYPPIPRTRSPTQMRQWEEDVLNDVEDQTAYGGSRFSTMKGGSTSKRRSGSNVKIELAPLDIEKARSVNERGPMSATAISARKHEKKIEAVKGGGKRVQVRIQPMCIFLLRDGTVISIHPESDLEFTAPIALRLRQPQTILRTSSDGSFLLQSLLDLIVDRALEVVDEYQAKILALEHDVLMKPHMNTIRFLHIIQGDLILHKRTMEPIKTVVYGLRRYDDDRAAALLEGQDYDPKKVKGYMSHKAKIYLADVNDHMEYILTSLDMFAGQAENLINYSFNMASNKMNEVMRQMTLATIIFLPLTLLTGYFGMNFDNMWAIHHGHTDLIFWIIALPVMVIVIPLFMWSDIKRWYRGVQKRMLAKQALRPSLNRKIKTQ